MAITKTVFDVVKDSIKPYIDSQNQTLSNEVRGNWSSGGINKLRNTASSKTENGVTFTVNADKSITVSTTAGGATANTNLTFNFDLKAGSYVLKSWVNTSAWSKSCLYIYKQNLVDKSDYQGGTFTLASDTVGIACTLRVASGCVISTPITYYPMIALATDANADYQPYAETNTELTRLIDGEIATRAKTGVHNFCSQTFAKGNYTSAGFVGNTYVASSKGFALKAGTYILSWTELADHPASILGNYLNIMADEIHSTDSNINLGSGNPITVTVPNDGIYAVQINVKNAGTNPAYSDAEIATLNSSLVLKLATDAYNGFLPKVPTNAELLSADANAELGAHNLCGGKFTSYVGTSGVTVSVDSDNVVTLSSTGNTTAENVTSDEFTLKKGTYILGKNPISISGIRIGLLVNNYIYNNILTYDEEIVFTATTDITCKVRLYVPAYTGAINNVKFYPIIRSISDPSTKFTPYAMTNRELTDKLASNVIASGSYTATAASTWESVTSFTLDKEALINVTFSYTNSHIEGIAITNNNTSVLYSKASIESSVQGALKLLADLPAGTWYLWVKYGGAVSNNYEVKKLMEI